MSEIVYVFGAGINRSIKDYQNLRPPLATDFFRQVLRHEMLEAEGQEELEELFDYIQKYWKLSVEFDYSASNSLDCTADTPCTVPASPPSPSQELPAYRLPGN